MANTEKTEEKQLDRTPVNLEAQGNFNIRVLYGAGYEPNPAIAEEWKNHEGGTRITRGQDITVEKHVADNLTKLMVKSINPKQLSRDVPAFVPSTNI